MLETVLALEPKHPSVWTDERVKMITDLQGILSASLIAERINQLTGSNISRNAVIGKMKRMGLCEPFQPAQHKLVKVSTNRKYYSNGAVVQKINKGPATKPVPYVVSHVDIVPLRKTILEVGAFECRAAYEGVGDEPTHVFCAHPVKAGASYCQSHAAVYLLPPPKKRKQKPLWRNDGRAA